MERGEIDRALKEQSLQAAFTPEGVAGRTALGKLLKAELLVITRQVKEQQANVLELVVCETARGLRLCSHRVALKTPEETVASLGAIVDRAIDKYSESITALWAVPPFLSRDLTDRYAHLKSAYARVMEQVLLDQPGVLVVELAEARAVAKEDLLAGGASGVSREPPIYVSGEFRTSGEGDARRVTIRLKASRGDTVLEVAASGELPPDDAPQYLRRQAAALSKSAGREIVLGESDSEIRQLIRRVKEFADTGQYAEAAELYEAALLLAPRNTEILAAQIDILRPLTEAAGLVAIHDLTNVETARVYYRFHNRGYECLGAMYRWHPAPWRFNSQYPMYCIGCIRINGDVEVAEAIRKMHGESMALREEVLLEMVRAIATRHPGLAETEIGGIGWYLQEIPGRGVAATLRAVEIVANSPHAKEYTLALCKNANGHWRWPHMEDGKLRRPNETANYRNPPTPDLFALVDAMEASPTPAVHEALVELKRIYEIQRVTPDERRRLAALYQTDFDIVEKKRLARVAYNSRNREFPRRSDEFRPSPVPLEEKPPRIGSYAPEMPPVIRSGGIVFRPFWLTTDASRLTDVREVIPVGDTMDAIRAMSHLFLVRKAGHADRAWTKRSMDRGITSISYDGRYLWGATEAGSGENPCLFVIDPQARQIWTFTTRDGLPFPQPNRSSSGSGGVYSRGLMVAALAPGKVCAVGSFGRSWVGVITFDPEKGIQVDVIFEAHKVLPESAVMEQDQHTRDASYGIWPMRIIPLRHALGVNGQPRWVLIFRSGGSGMESTEWRMRPLLCDLQDRQCRVVDPPLLRPIPYYFESPEFQYGQTAGALYGIGSSGSLIRLSAPGFVQQTQAPLGGPGLLLIDKDRFHVAGRRWITGRLADGHIQFQGQVPWQFGREGRTDLNTRILEGVFRSNVYGLMAVGPRGVWEDGVFYQILLPGGESTDAGPGGNPKSLPAASGPKLRIWHDVKRNAKFEATFLKLQGGILYTQKKGGGLIGMPLEDLSEEDRNYVAKAIRGQAD